MLRPRVPAQHLIVRRSPHICAALALAVAISGCSTAPTRTTLPKPAPHIRFRPAATPTHTLLPIPVMPSTRSTIVAAVRHATCQPAGATGLDTAMVASSYERITGRVNAYGCQVAIYIPPAAHNVVLKDLAISNASEHAVFAQNASQIAITDSRVSVSAAAANTTLGSAPPPPEDKTIVLVGTTDALVEYNVLAGNWNLGISVTDDGPVDPAADRPGIPSAARGNAVIGNMLSGGVRGCGIVVAAYNPGEGVTNNLIAANTLKNVTPGGIVIAADPPGTAAIGNVVQDNVIWHNQLPGVIVHSNSAGQTVSDTVVTGNTIVDSGTMPSYLKFLGILGGHRTGVAILGFSVAPQGTVVSHNVISGEHYGIYQADAAGTRLAGNTVMNLRQRGRAFFSLPHLPPGSSSYYEGPDYYHASPPSSP